MAGLAPELVLLPPSRTSSARPTPASWPALRRGRASWRRARHHLVRPRIPAALATYRELLDATPDSSASISRRTDLEAGTSRLQGGVPGQAQSSRSTSGITPEKPIAGAPGSMAPPRNSRSDGDRAGGALMAGGRALPLVLALAGPDPGAAEADRGVVLDAEEVVGAHVGVAGVVLGVDRVGVDLELQGRVLGPLGDGGDAGDGREPAADLGHQVAGDELEGLVGRVDLPGAGLGHRTAVRRPRVPGVVAEPSLMLSPSRGRMLGCHIFPRHSTRTIVVPATTA